jgi:hypothetical protein
MEAIQLCFESKVYYIALLGKNMADYQFIARICINFSLHGFAGTPQAVLSKTIPWNLRSIILKAPLLLAVHLARPVHYSSWVMFLEVVGRVLL